MPAAALAVGGIGSIIGGISGASASKKAAKAQVDAANHAADLQHQDAQEAMGFQKDQYSDAKRMLAPYYNTGTQSLQQLARLMGLQGFSDIPYVFPPYASNAPSSTGQVPGNASMLRDPYARMAERGGFNPMMDGAMGDGTAAMLPNGGFGFNRDAGQAEDPNGFGTSMLGPPMSANASPEQLTVPGGGGTNDGMTGFLARPWTENFVAPNDVTEKNDPGYQFRLKEGQRLLEQSAAARGGLLTGGTAKDLENYGQNVASDEFSKVYDRAMQQYTQRYNIFKGNQNDLYNRFASLAGLGQTSTSQLNSAGQNFANQSGNILMNSANQIGQQYNNAGAARASGYIGAANSYGGAINGVSNMAMLYALMRQNGGSGGGGNV